MSTQLSLFDDIDAPVKTKANNKKRKKSTSKNRRKQKVTTTTQNSLFSLLETPLGVTINNKSPKETFLLLDVANRIVSRLESRTKIDSKSLKQEMVTVFGGTDAEGFWTWKDAYNALEMALILLVRKDPSLRNLQALLEVTNLLPTHSIRSEEMVERQQFSTPLPLAWLMGEAAQLTKNDLVLEPSAGTGMLAIWAEIKGAKLLLNEISKDRVKCLKQLFNQKVTAYNGEQIDNYLTKRPSVVIMNPPFTCKLNSRKKGHEATVLHLQSAMGRLAPGGRLVTLSGNTFSPTHHKWKEVFEKLGHVVFSAGVVGDAYKKHGTTIETRLTVIDKCEDTKNKGVVTADVVSLEAVESLLQELPYRPLFVEEISSPKPVAKPQLFTSKAPTKNRKKTSSTSTNVTPESPLVTDIIDVEYSPAARNNDVIGDLQEDGIYEQYLPQTIKFADAKVHPTKLVESAAMAAVSPPTPTYIPKLPRKVVEYGLLSDAQLESVVYAGEAHSKFLPDHYVYDENLDTLKRVTKDDEEGRKYRCGWFLGDGTGVGKGRQCAGMIMDNWLKGRRKAVWISKSNTLLEDARRDWKALGGDPKQVIALSKFKQGEKVTVKEGIIFLTYATLRTAAKANKCSRVEQLVGWLGKDSENIIIFDESHAMGNAVGEIGVRGHKAPSQQGIAGLRLQRLLPNARFVFVSATGATKLDNLGYLERLGLWNSETLPFVSREDFLSQIGEGGIAALEVVARDLKSMGLYLARSVSFDGVEYEIIEHNLTSKQVEMYNKYADAYLIIHQNIEQALETTGIASKNGPTNGMAKSQVISRFEMCKQRFFGHLITSIKCPTLIKNLEADLEAGKAAVIQIISTDEALLDRRLNQIPVSQWDNINVDITPREYLFDYLINGFPVHQYETITDENGNERNVLVKDAEDNSVACQEAIRKRDKLIQDLSLLPPLPSALDQIINHFGYEAVAEVTGRSKRLIRITKEGDDRIVVDKRSSSSNLAESKAFMDDEKQILIFSEAGGTGRSYHSDRDCINQRPRVHYLLEGGWRADTAIQGLGRTNRSNQAHPPVYKVICTNVKGEKRFISTIARRLASLGALTKGERKTGNQGLFREEDNLESLYAKQALRSLYYGIFRGVFKGMSMNRFEEISGLRLTTKEGDLKAELPPMKTFLNRVLAMRLSDQEILFETLEMAIESAIEKAKEAGIYEKGVETIRAEALKVVNREVLYEDPQGGASYTVEVEKTERNRILTLPDALKLAEYSGTFFAKNERSGQVALVSTTTSSVNPDGSVESRVYLTKPCSSTKLTVSQYDRSNWYRIKQSEFEACWQQQVEEEPKFKTSTFYLITGLLLPIWKRLDSREMRIYRIQTVDGERLLGRAVMKDAMNLIARRFAKESNQKTVEDIYTSVMTDGKMEKLTERFQLRKSLVRGDYRLELLGFQNSREINELKQLGVTSEYVNYSLRLFIPFHNAVRILRQIQENYYKFDAVAA